MGMGPSIECKDGGTLRKIARGPWGQITLRTVPPGKTVGGHSHPNTTERWWVAVGQAEILLDFGAWRTILRPVPWDVTLVRPGTFHWLTNVGDCDLMMVYWLDKAHEEQEKSPAPGFIDGGDVNL